MTCSKLLPVLLRIFKWLLIIVKRMGKIFNWSTTGLRFIDFLPPWFKYAYSLLMHRSHFNRGWKKHVVGHNFAVMKDLAPFGLSPLLLLCLLYLIPELGECFTYGSVLGLVQESVRNNAMQIISVHRSVLTSLPLREIFVFIEILFSYGEFSVLIMN